MLYKISAEYRHLSRGLFCIAQNPLHQFPSNFPVDGEAANLLRTCRLCCGLVTDLLRGNWRNGFWVYPGVNI